MIHDNMTVGYLKKFLEDNNIPDDAVIHVERVQDVYFEKYGWSKTSVFKEEEEYNIEKTLIDRVKDGYFDDKEQYPNITEEWKENVLKFEPHLDSSKTEYHHIWCPVKYENDNNLYLDLHY